MEAPDIPPVVGYVGISGFWNWVGTGNVWVPAMGRHRDFAPSKCVERYRGAMLVPDPP
jgi:hypothetical protein